MNPSESRHDRISELFLTACDLADDERAAFLARECANDEALRAEIEQMLAVDAGDALLDRPLASQLIDGLEPVLPDDATSTLPERIGRYEILGSLGTGGMGAVYRARQSNPTREVALKVVRPGMMSPGIARRFRNEAELLGRLSHPGIAQVFEAGEAETALGTQPFLAMELVGGQRLDEWAAGQRPLRARLELVARIADAVHHAHQRGVLHRDLKPSNVIVDDHGQPKVLDFGVGRAAEEGRTLLTMPGQIVGTLGYMSPEQVDGDSDVRSDIYSLAAMAFELVTGKLPIDVRDLGVAEAARRIVEVEPAKPSATDRALRGDVETVLLKALDKNPDRRYESAAAFAKDLRRHLNHETVSARPPSAVYQLKKLARRHRAAFSASVIAILALVVGLVAALVSANRAAARLEESDGLVEYFENMLHAADPAIDGPNVRLREALARGTDAMQDFVTRFPRAEGRIRLAMGTAWFTLADYTRAREHLKRSLELLDADDARHLRALNAYCNTLAMLDVDEDLERVARDLIREATARRGPAAEEIVTGHAALASAFIIRTDYAKAREIVDNGIVAAEQHGHTDKLAYVHLLTRLGDLQRWTGGLSDSVATQERVVNLCETNHGADHASTIAQKLNLANRYQEVGRYQEADELLVSSLARLGDRYPADHSLVLDAKLTHAYTLRGLGRLDEALELLREITPALQRIYGEHSESVVVARTTQGKILLTKKDPTAAVEILEPIHAHHCDTHGPGHLQTCFVTLPLTRAFNALKRFEDAEKLLRQTIEQADVPAENPILVQLISNLSHCLRRQKRPADAKEFSRAAVTQAPAAFGADHPQVFLFQRDLAIVHLELGEWNEAEAVLVGAAANLERTQGKEHRWTLSVTNLLKQLRARRPK
ncbi:MAG: serine/threonine-protein kinase [bacterium]|nr:serine/threonine-protein kinase [bacterium]